MVTKCSIGRPPCGESITAEPDDQFIGHVIGILSAGR